MYMQTSSQQRLEKLLQKEHLRILVVIRDHMSGLLYGVPSLRALRNNFPTAEITLLANHFALPILAGCPYVDKTIPFYRFHEQVGWYDRVESFVDRTEALLKLYNRIDLVIHLRYVGSKTLRFAKMLGDPFQVGYSQGEYDELLDLNLGEDDESLDSRTRNAKILATIGIEVDSHEMELWIPQAEIEYMTGWLYSHGWNEEELLFVFHPGCHWGCNEWLVERWIALGNELAQEWGGRIVLTGTIRERPLAEKIACWMAVPPLIATGETTLLQFAALLQKATAVISVDTSPTQICQALKKPAVILMGAGNLAWNGPLPGEPMIMLQKLTAEENRVEYCDFGSGICHHASCESRLKNIQVQEVILALEKVLADHRINPFIPEPLRLPFP